jgi:hypothetical protein
MLRITVLNEDVEAEVAKWRARGFKVRVEPGRVFNSDTDSVMTNVELPCSKTLGDMKDEYPAERYKRTWDAKKKQWVVTTRSSELLSGTFIQPKCYVLEKVTPFAKEHRPDCKSKACKGCSPHKIAMKGLPKRQRTYENIQRLLKGEEVEFERLEKVRTLAAEGFDRPPQMVQVKKRIVSAYDKRVIQDDGVTTKPVRVWMPDIEEDETPIDQADEAAE